MCVCDRDRVVRGCLLRRDRRYNTPCEFVIHESQSKLEEAEVKLRQRYVEGKYRYAAVFFSLQSRGGTP